MKKKCLSKGVDNKPCRLPGAFDGFCSYHKLSREGKCLGKTLKGELCKGPGTHEGYCSRHKINVPKCLGKTKDNKPCTLPGEFDGYCSWHNPNAKKCLGVTSRGKPCQLPGDYDGCCWDHRPATCTQKQGDCKHGHRKNLCYECGGGSLCEHRSQKRQCRECGGNMYCEHDVRKYRCTQCRQKLSLEEILGRYKNACLICGKECQTSKTEKLCREHSIDYKKRPEHYWQEIVDSKFAFPASSLDEASYTDVDCNGQKYRPDRTFLSNELDTAFILEFDEHSHRGYNINCEIKRTTDMKDIFRDFKYVLLLRMNPDACSALPSELQDLTDKTIFFLQILQEYFEPRKIEAELDELRVNVLYFFYGKTGYKHIDAAKKEPSIQIIGEYYCNDELFPTQT